MTFSEILVIIFTTATIRWGVMIGEEIYRDWTFESRSQNMKNPF